MVSFFGRQDTQNNNKKRDTQYSDQYRSAECHYAECRCAGMLNLKWCLHLGVNCSKLEPFLNAENIFGASKGTSLER